MFDWLAVIQRRGLASGLVLHVAINYKEDELTIFCLVFVFFKRTDARAARVKVLALFFFFFLFLYIYVRPFFMSSTSFVYGTFLHHRPYHIHWRKKKKTHFLVFILFIFCEHFTAPPFFLEPTSFQLSQLDVGPLSGCTSIYTTQRERERGQTVNYILHIYILRCLRKTGATAVFGLSSLCIIE